MSIPTFLHIGDDLFTLFAMTPDLVCIAGKDGFFKNFNPAVPATLGYSSEELFAKSISSFIHPDDKDITGTRRKDLIRGETLLNFQNRYLTKTGQVVWLEWTSVYLPDKKVVFAIAKNISSRMQIEQEVKEQYRKLQQLTTNYKNYIEQEKKYLAKELHEQLAQLASVVKIEVNWISTNIAQPTSAVKERIDHALVMSDLLVNTLQRISFSISPGMLHDLGLVAALEWYCQEFSITSGISCSFTSDYQESALTGEVQLDFFRICQEALGNVKKYSQASEVKVNILDAGAKIVFIVADNGIGYEPGDFKQIQGMLTMYERAASINAKCIMDHEPGKGNRVVVEIGK